MIRVHRSRRNRRHLSANDSPAGTQAVAVFTIVANKARLTFNVPVVVNGIPKAITNENVAPTAVTSISPTVLDLTYAANVVATDIIIIPGGVEEIRTNTGGYVAAASYTFP